MNSTLKAQLKILAASLALVAASQAGATVLPVHSASLVQAVFYPGNPTSHLRRLRTEDAASAGAVLYFAPQMNAPDGFPPFESDALALDNSAMDHEPNTHSSRYRYAVRRLDAVGNTGDGFEPAAPSLRSTPSVRAQVNAQAAQSVGLKASIPEPGNWAKLLACLLCAGAIARRRMSA